MQSIPTDRAEDDISKTAGGNLSRRDFLKFSGGALATFLLGSYIPVARASGDESPDEGQLETLNTPYNLELLGENEHTSFQDFNLDGLAINIGQFLQATTVQRNNQKVYELIEGSDFLSSESSNKLIELLGITPELVGGGFTPERIQITLQDIFEDVRHGLKWSVENKAMKFSLKTFREGIARSPEDNLPMIGEGDDLIGIILGTKVLADLFVTNPSNAALNHLRENINITAFQDIFINLIRNNTTAEDLHPIDVNYLTINNSYRLAEGFEANDVRNIPDQDRERFARVFNERMNAINSTNVSRSLANVLATFLSPNGLEGLTMQDVNSVIREKTSFAKLIEDSQTTLRSSQELGIEPPSGLIDFISNLGDSVRSFPNSNSLQINFEEAMIGLSADDRIAFMFLRTLAHCTGSFIYSIVLPETENPTIDIFAERILNLYNNQSVSLPTTIFPLVELLGFGSASINPNSHDPSDYRDANQVNVAKFYTLKNLWLSAKNFVESGEPTYESTPVNMQADLRKILDFHQSYREYILESYDSSADKSLESHVGELSQIINGLRHIRNLHEIREYNFVSPNYLPGFAGEAYRETKEIQTKLTLVSMDYNSDNPFHEELHMRDGKLAPYLAAKDDRGIKPREAIYSWSLFHNMMNSFSRQYGNEVLESTLNEHDPWNGYTTTLRNLQEIKSLLSQVQLDLPEGLSRSEALDELYSKFESIRLNDLSGVRSSIDQLPHADRRRLMWFALNFFNERYEQDMRHQIQGARFQNNSQLNNVDPAWIRNLSPRDKIHLANQLADQLTTFRDQSFSNIDSFTKRTLFRDQPQLNIDQFIGILFEQHYRYTNARTFSPVDLAYKTSLFNLQFNSEGTFEGTTGLNLSYIQDWENDMNELFSSERISEQTKTEFVSKFVEYIELMSVENSSSKISEVLHYLTNQAFLESTSGLQELKRRIDQIRDQIVRSN